MTSPTGDPRWTAARSSPASPPQPWSPRAAASRETRPWQDILAAARGQTVYWNAWAGDERTNAFIAWAGEETRRRFGVTRRPCPPARHRRGRHPRGGREGRPGAITAAAVDLIWINGPNFLAMKTQGLLHGPFAEALPNWRFVDTTRQALAT